MHSRKKNVGSKILSNTDFEVDFFYIPKWSMSKLESIVL